MKKPSHLFTNQNKFSSYWFRTFSHPSFTKLFFIILYKFNRHETNFFSKNSFKRKTISPNLIRDHITPRSLAYWIMCDGSLTKTKKALILHTEGFTEKERNEFTILIPTEDRVQLASLITQYMIPSMTYKIPILLNPTMDQMLTKVLSKSQIRDL